MENNQILLLVSLIILTFSVGIFFYPPYSMFSVRGMHHQMIGYRDMGIKKSIAEGEYNCCVEPACTMCFMQGNQWNHGEAGTCACAELIAQGKEPCPQCHRALSKSEDQTCLIEQECQEE